MQHGAWEEVLDNYYPTKAANKELLKDGLRKNVLGKLLTTCMVNSRNKTYKSSLIFFYEIHNRLVDSDS